MFDSLFEWKRLQTAQPVKVKQPRKPSQVVVEKTPQDGSFMPIDQVFERLIESDRLQSI